MSRFRPNFITRPYLDTPTLELNIGGIPVPETLKNWPEIVESITADWVEANQYERKGTLWMWRSHSQRFHANGISIFISQCGLPSRYLKYLQQQLTQIFGARVAYGGTYWIQREKGWLPLCHVENGMAWKPVDSVGNHWVRVSELV